MINGHCGHILPHDTDWSVSSYKEIIVLDTMEEVLMLYEGLPEVMIKNCMLFLMRNGIQPTFGRMNIT